MKICKPSIIPSQFINTNNKAILVKNINTLRTIIDNLKRTNLIINNLDSMYDLNIKDQSWPIVVYNAGFRCNSLDWDRYSAFIKPNYCPYDILQKIELIKIC